MKTITVKHSFTLSFHLTAIPHEKINRCLTDINQFSPISLKFNRY